MCANIDAGECKLRVLGPFFVKYSSGNFNASNSELEKRRRVRIQAKFDRRYRFKSGKGSELDARASETGVNPLCRVLD
ncbi:hypothetical protein [Methylomonas koyamae]|uniref:hypothetical protein n=1 Tax=Methylomonas koyamae TaxID=702114 RepID=UPI0012F64801|nr:hypothetical protein [Methylomonas koyamae]